MLKCAILIFLLFILYSLSFVYFVLFCLFFLKIKGRDGGWSRRLVADVIVGIWR